MCWMPTMSASTGGSPRHPHRGPHRAPRTDAGVPVPPQNGRILGKTVFDTGLEAVYDMELGEYTLFPVKAGTILIDASLCEEETSTGRLRFTEAHELSHWILHKGLYTGTGRARRCSLPSGKPVWRSRRICLGPPCSCPCQWSSGVSTKCGPVGIIRPLFRPCRRCFRYPARPCGSGSPTTICCKIFYCGVLKIENTLEGGTPCTSEKNPCGALPCVR